MERPDTPPETEKEKQEKHDLDTWRETIEKLKAENKGLISDYRLFKDTADRTEQELIHYQQKNMVAIPISEYKRLIKFELSVEMFIIYLSNYVVESSYISDTEKSHSMKMAQIFNRKLYKKEDL